MPALLIHGPPANPADLFPTPRLVRYGATIHRSDSYHAVSLVNGAALILDRRNPRPDRWIELPPGEHARRFRMRAAGVRKRWGRWRPGLTDHPPWVMIDRLCAAMLDAALGPRTVAQRRAALMVDQMEG